VAQSLVEAVRSEQLLSRRRLLTARFFSLHPDGRTAFSSSRRFNHHHDKIPLVTLQGASRNTPFRPRCSSVPTSSRVSFGALLTDASMGYISATD
jgi:hypothetical protein